MKKSTLHKTASFSSNFHTILHCILKKHDYFLTEGTPSTPLTVDASTDSSKSGKEEPGPGTSERSLQKETPLEKRPGFWVPFIAVVIALVPATVFVVRCRRRQNRRLTNTNPNEIPMRPLLGKSTALPPPPSSTLTPILAPATN